MRKLELYLKDDEFERLTVLRKHLNLKESEIDVMLRLGLFNTVFDLSCLKYPAEIEKMEEYLSRMEEK